MPVDHRVAGGPEGLRVHVVAGRSSCSGSRRGSSVGHPASLPARQGSDRRRRPRTGSADTWPPRKISDDRPKMAITGTISAITTQVIASPLPASAGRDHRGPGDPVVDPLVGGARDGADEQGEQPAELRQATQAGQPGREPEQPQPRSEREPARERCPRFQPYAVRGAPDLEARGAACPAWPGRCSSRAAVK